MSCDIISYHIISCHVMSCHVISCYVMSCHVMSYHVMSCHVMSYNHILYSFQLIQKCVIKLIKNDISSQGPDLSLDDMNRISSKDYAKTCQIENENHIQLDVRVDAQYNMINFNWYATQHKPHVYNRCNGQTEQEECFDRMKRNESRLARAVESSVRVVHFPLAEMKKMRPNLLKIEILNRIKAITNENYEEKTNSTSSSSTQKKKTSKSKVKVEVEVDMNEVPTIYCMCRRGVDSILATQLLLELGFHQVANVEGGLTAWNSTVDKTFPIY